MRVSYRSKRGLLSAGVVFSMFGCSGGTELSEPSATTEPGTTTIESNTPTVTASRAAPTTTTLASTSGIDEAQAEVYIEAIGKGLFPGLGDNFLAGPEVACFRQAAGKLSSEQRQTLQTLADNPSVWEETAGDDTFPLAEAYFSCADPDDLVQSVVVMTVPVIDSIPCVVDAWRGKVTADLVAQSVSYSRGLSDLPPALADELAATAAVCAPTDAKWLEQLSLEIAVETGLLGEDPYCVATAYVDELGIERAIRLRLLNLPLLTLPPEDQLRLDLAGRCKIDLAWRPAELGATPGDCLSGFGSGHDATTIVTCEGEHNAEVVGMHDLTSTLSDWPGVRGVEELKDELCAKDFDAVTGDAPGYYGGYDIPIRQSWEQGGRVITCVIFRDGYAPWQGPSGLMPGTGTATTEAPSSATSAPPTNPEGLSSSSAQLLAEHLPPVPGYVYNHWTQAAIDRFTAGPDHPKANVALFSASDVSYEGQAIARIELYLLMPSIQSLPDLDEVVLDDVSSSLVYPGQQSSERHALPGEQILIRRSPTLVAWTWTQRGVVFNVVAEGVPSGPAGDFVAALSAIQQVLPIPAPTTP